MIADRDTWRGSRYGRVRILKPARCMAAITCVETAAGGFEEK
jgi:hypothetical protein